MSKVWTQRIIAKEPRTKKSKTKEVKPNKGKAPPLLHPKSTEPGKTSCIDRKREYLKKKCDQKNTTLATGNNANIVKDSKKRQNKQVYKNCFNC